MNYGMTRERERRAARRNELALALIAGAAIAGAVCIGAFEFVQYVVNDDARNLMNAERATYSYMTLDSAGNWNVDDYNLTLGDCVELMSNSDEKWFSEQCEETK